MADRLAAAFLSAGTSLYYATGMMNPERGQNVI